MRTRPLNFRLPHGIVDELDRLRTEQRRTRSNLVQRYILEGLERDGVSVNPKRQPRADG